MPPMVDFLKGTLKSLFSLDAYEYVFVSITSYCIPLEHRLPKDKIFQSLLATMLLDGHFIATSNKWIIVASIFDHVLCTGNYYDVHM